VLLLRILHLPEICYNSAKGAIKMRVFACLEVHSQVISSSSIKEWSWGTKSLYIKPNDLPLMTNVTGHILRGDWDLEDYRVGRCNYTYTIMRFIDITPPVVCSKANHIQYAPSRKPRSERSILRTQRAGVDANTSLRGGTLQLAI